MMLHVPQHTTISDPLGDRQLVVGWREWVSLPSLMAEPLRAKIDTGARTSALHAQNLSIDRHAGRTVATFTIPAGPNRHERRINADVIEERAVRSSNGVEELRPVIITDLLLGRSVWPIEVTLTDRELMGFPMLVGRSALRNRCLIDPNRSFCTGMPYVATSFDHLASTTSTH